MQIIRRKHNHTVGGKNCSLFILVSLERAQSRRNGAAHLCADIKPFTPIPHWTTPLSKQL